MGIRRKKTFTEQVVDYVENAVEQVRPHVEQAVDTARDKAVPLLQDARDKAGPVLVDARDRARPVIADGAALAADKAALVAAVAATKAAEGREIATAKALEGRDLAAAKVAELKGEEPPKKGGKLKKLVLFGGLAAVAAFVASKLKGDQDSKNWQSSYTPTPPPAPPTPAPAPTADDSAGSSPDEALADSAESAHAVSTPDEPADEVVLDPDADTKS
jgi:hypothetical protein